MDEPIRLRLADGWLTACRGMRPLGSIELLYDSVRRVPWPGAVTETTVRVPLTRAEAELLRWQLGELLAQQQQKVP